MDKLLASATATKKINTGSPTPLPPPHSLCIKQWLAYFLDIVMLELSTARINKAKSLTIDLWRNAAAQVSVLLTSASQELEESD